MKHEVRVQWGGSSGLQSKIRTRLHGMNFCTSLAHFELSVVMQQTIPNAPKQYEMHQSMSLASNGVDRMHSLQKIPTRLRGTNFCTSQARFELSVVTQQTIPNAPKQYETHQNISLGPNGANRVCLLRNIKTRLRGTNFCTLSPFCSEFCKATKRSQMHRKSMKHTKT